MILNLYKNKQVTYEEMVLLYIIYDNSEVQIENLYNTLNIKMDVKKTIKDLYNKNYVNIDWEKSKVMVSKRRILEENKEKEINIGQHLYDQKIAKKEVTVEHIDKIRVILNREIKPHELMQLQKWYEQYEMEEIIDAIYKSCLKDIDNFNYIEKVLFNEPQEKKEPTKIKKVQKNFDFFTNK